MGKMGGRKEGLEWWVGVGMLVILFILPFISPFCSAHNLVVLRTKGRTKEKRGRKKRKRGRLSLIISFFLPSPLPPSGPSFPSARAPPFPAGPPLRCPAGGKVKLSTVTLYAKSVRIFPLIARGSCGVSERDLDAAGLTVMHANVVRSTAFYGTKRPGIFVGFVE